MATRPGKLNHFQGLRRPRGRPQNSIKEFTETPGIDHEPTTHVTADLGSLCPVDDDRLGRAYEVALRTSVVQVSPM